MPNAMDEIIMALAAPSLLIMIYNSTPRKISSSNKTDLIFHHSPFRKRLKLNAGLTAHVSLAKYILSKYPDVAQTAVTIRNSPKSASLFPVGQRPSTRRSFFLNSHISNHETAS